MKKVIRQNFNKKCEELFQFTREEYLTMLKSICYVIVDTQLYLEGEWDPDHHSMQAMQDKAVAILEALGDFRSAGSIYEVWRAANNAAAGGDPDDTFLQPVLEDIGSECTTNQSSEQTTSSSEKEVQS